MACSKFKEASRSAPRKKTLIEELTLHAGIAIHSLDKECTDNEIVGLAKFCDPWRVIAYHLELKQSDVSAINEDNLTTEEKRLAVLHKWRERFSMKATVRRFIDALLKCDQVDKASKVCELMKPPGPTRKGMKHASRYFCPSPSAIWGCLLGIVFVYLYN